MGVYGTPAHMAYPGYVARPRMPTVSHVSIDHLSGTPVYVQLAALLRDLDRARRAGAGPAAAVVHDADAGARRSPRHGCQGGTGACRRGPGQDRARPRRLRHLGGTVRSTRPWPLRWPSPPGYTARYCHEDQVAADVEAAERAPVVPVPGPAVPAGRVGAASPPPDRPARDQERRRESHEGSAAPVAGRGSYVADRG